MSSKEVKMSSIDEDVDDRLSGLPEDTISHILSLMPTKFAVRTSILSKRWRYSWMGEILSKFVDRVMENCKSSQLGLLRLPFSSKQVKRESLSSWIDKAVRLNVSEIDMQVLSFELPISLFTCKTLTKLRIDDDNLSSRVWECPCPVNLPSLKTLDIVVFNNPFVNAFELIRGCPILESLSLEIFIHKEEEEDYIFNIPTLKRLKQIVQRVYSSVTKKVVLNVPNLDYLFVGGMLGSLFVMEDLSSLVEASTSFRCLWSDGMWLEFLKGISGVKSLSIKKVSFQLLFDSICCIVVDLLVSFYSFVDFCLQFHVPIVTLYLLKFPFNLVLPIFPHVRHLRLTSLWYSRLVLEFLERCPELKHLCIEELTDERWIKPKLIPACLLTNLTTINHLRNLSHKRRKLVACKVA
ncbi:putative F-box domain, leucine-rich repeat domain superfamily, F-box-like domain superfamily [Helianthus anomalus]